MSYIPDFGLNLKLRRVEESEQPPKLGEELTGVPNLLVRIQKMPTEGYDKNLVYRTGLPEVWVIRAFEIDGEGNRTGPKWAALSDTDPLAKA